MGTIESKIEEIMKSASVSKRQACAALDICKGSKDRAINMLSMAKEIGIG